jgi:hypothetical protein
MANNLRFIPLTEVLKITCAERCKQDKNKWDTEQGKISISGMKFINWSKQIGGGGAIDLIMHLKNIDFKTAVIELSELFSIFSYNDIDDDNSTCNRGLKIPVSDYSKFKWVKKYLYEKRGINHRLIEKLYYEKILYSDRYANAIFLLLGKNNITVGAEIRGTGHKKWCTMAIGSKKDQGYFSIKNEKINKSSILCESAIDAISCLILYPNCHCISTSGARSNPLWLNALIAENYNVYCGFDSDETGDKMASAMIKLHPSIIRLRPKKHDWNEVLKSKK